MSTGTIARHRAVDRDFHPWYERERPAAFGRMQAGATREIDPAGICNTDVLVR